MYGAGLFVIADSASFDISVFPMLQFKGSLIRPLDSRFIRTQTNFALPTRRSWSGEKIGFIISPRHPTLSNVNLKQRIWGFLLFQMTSCYKRTLRNFPTSICTPCSATQTPALSIGGKRSKRRVPTPCIEPCLGILWCKLQYYPHWLLIYTNSFYQLNISLLHRSLHDPATLSRADALEQIRLIASSEAFKELDTSILALLPEKPVTARRQKKQKIQKIEEAVVNFAPIEGDGDD